MLPAFFWRRFIAIFAAAVMLLFHCHHRFRYSCHFSCPVTTGAVSSGSVTISYTGSRSCISGCTIFPRPFSSYNRYRNQF